MGKAEVKRSVEAYPSRLLSHIESFPIILR